MYQKHRTSFIVFLIFFCLLLISFVRQDNKYEYFQENETISSINKNNTLQYLQNGDILAYEFDVDNFSDKPFSNRPTITSLKTTTTKTNKQTTKKKTIVSKTKLTQKQYKPNSIYYRNSTIKITKRLDNIPYGSFEQHHLDKMTAIIDSGHVLMTGPEFNLADGRSNYLIAHGNGKFKPLRPLRTGHTIIITDKNGIAYTYKIVDHVIGENNKLKFNEHERQGILVYYGSNEECVYFNLCLNEPTKVLLAKAVLIP